MEIKIGVISNMDFRSCIQIKNIYDKDDIVIIQIRNLDRDILNTHQLNAILIAFCFNSCCPNPSSSFILATIKKKDTGFCVEHNHIQAVSCTKNLILSKVIYLFSGKKYLEAMNLHSMKQTRFINSVLAYLEEDSFSTAKKIAKKLNYSQEHFSEKFKADAEITFVKFRQIYRITKLLFYLKETEYTIPEIADLLNYSTASNVYRDINKYIKGGIKFLKRNRESISVSDSIRQN